MTGSFAAGLAAGADDVVAGDAALLGAVVCAAAAFAGGTECEGAFDVGAAAGRFVVACPEGGCEGDLAATLDEAGAGGGCATAEGTEGGLGG